MSHCVMCVTIFYLIFKQNKYYKCFLSRRSYVHSGTLKEKTVLDAKQMRIHSRDIEILGWGEAAWEEAAPLALVGHPSSGAVLIKMSHEVDVLH